MELSMVVRTRFAPSPTGDLHVGGVRTALYAWLYAKNKGGEFILRIENTDAERSTEVSVNSILEGLQWVGITPDEGPIYQTDRYVRYKEMADYLLENNKAYRCICSKERLEKLREEQLNAKEKPRYDGHCRHLNLPLSDAPYVIRFKNPKDGTVSFVDEVYGAIEVENSELDDLILIRTDGNPTYNFAVVIDDADMNITHVIRGDDHINNTPRQINLFHALDIHPPIFAHLPMILGEDGKRLSKRHGAVSVLAFKEAGILPHALLNYLIRLGWSQGDKEIFSLEEMIHSFDLNHVSRGVSTFNYDKLYWLNQHYLKTMPPQALEDAARWHFDSLGIDTSQGPALAAVIALQAERCKTLVELAEKSVYFYIEAIVYDESAVKKHLRPVAREPLTLMLERLREEKQWDAPSLHNAIIEMSERCGINMGKIGQPLRVAVTGSGSSPAIDATLALIGRDVSLKRLEDALNRFF